MIWLENILWFLTGSYAVFTLWLWRSWNGIPVFRRTDEGKYSRDQVLISVIIPVRNEAAGITSLLEGLHSQSLTKALFEVIVIDDGSTDETGRLVIEFAGSHDIRISLLNSDGDRSASPKKRAISLAMQKANGKYVVTTDGDCRVGPGWLTTLISCFESTGAKCISGPVTFIAEETVTDYLQTVEFSSLVGSGACAIKAGRPNMCNGANFAYEKAAFFEVGGFDGVDQIASGDDEFLLHKISVKYPNGVFFIKSEEAIVQTVPHRSWRSFKSQRQRWASKWKYYTSSSPKVLAVFVFLANLSVITAGLFYAFGIVSGHIAIAVVLLKVLPEWLFIGSVLRFLKKDHTLIYIPLVQLVYPFYVVFFGLAGQTKSYHWKGRELS